MDMTQSELQAGAPDTSAIGLLQAALAGLYTPRRLAIVMLIQALLLLGHVTDSWHASPDSAAYLGLARSIAEGDGYTFNHAPHTQYPPLYPLFLAGQFAVIGRSYIALNACQAALALICTPMAFWLLRRLYGKDLGFLGAAMFGINFCLWRTASIMLSDMLFILLGTLAMLAALWAARCGDRRWLAVTVTGAIIGLGSLARVNAPMIVPGAAVALWWGWSGRSRSARILALVVLIALSVAPLLVWRSYIESIHFGERLGYMDTWYFANAPYRAAVNLLTNMFLNIPRAMSELLLGFGGVPIGVHLLVPGVVVVGCVISLRNRRPLVPLTLAGWAAVLIPVPGVGLRHVLFLAPALFVLALIGVVAVVRRFRTDRTIDARKLRRVVVILFVILAAAHVGHSVKKLRQYRKGSVPGGPRIGNRAGWFTASDYILTHAGGRPQDLTVLTRRPGLVHFLTRARTFTTKALGKEGLDQQTVKRVRQYRPQYLLSELDDPITASALDVIRQAGGEATKVPDLKLTKSITLWRIVYPPRLSPQ